MYLKKYALVLSYHCVERKTLQNSLARPSPQRLTRFPTHLDQRAKREGKCLGIAWCHRQASITDHPRGIADVRHHTGYAVAHRLSDDVRESFVARRRGSHDVKSSHHVRHVVADAQEVHPIFDPITSYRFLQSDVLQIHILAR